MCVTPTNMHLSYSFITLSGNTMVYICRGFLWYCCCFGVVCKMVSLAFFFFQQVSTQVDSDAATILSDKADRGLTALWLAE